MFFGRIEPFNVENCIVEEYLTLSGFNDYLTNTFGMLVLQGYGFCTYEVQGQFKEYRGYHILVMNNEVFGFVGTLAVPDSGSKGNIPGAKSQLLFSKIVKFDQKLLNSNIFEDIRYSGNVLEYLEASIAIDGKLYEYEDEDRMIFSKKGEGSIDMFGTYSYFHKTNILKTYLQTQSIQLAGKQQAMMNLLDKKVSHLQASKNSAPPILQNISVKPEVEPNEELKSED